MLCLSLHLLGIFRVHSFGVHEAQVYFDVYSDDIGSSYYENVQHSQQAA